MIIYIGNTADISLKILIDKFKFLFIRVLIRSKEAHIDDSTQQ